MWKGDSIKTHFKILVLLLFSLTTGKTFSQWSTDPSNNLIVGYGLNPEICSDSTGGCFITYEENTTYPRHLILERLNRYGYRPWGQSRQILGILSEQRSAKITEDGRCGVIVSYEDVEFDGFTGFERLRVQRIDSSGNFVWGTNGVRVSIAETDQSNQTIISDGDGGCIIAWIDTTNNLRIQRIGSSGGRAWGDSGLFVWNSTSTLPPIVSDGKGGCYIVFNTGRMQRFDHDGNMQWSSKGIFIPTGASSIQLDNDGNIYLLGGKYLGFQNGASLFTINYQKIDSSGNILWDSLGVTLDTLNTNNQIFLDFSLQENYSTIAWLHDGESDFRTQFVRHNGSTIFPLGGTKITENTSTKIFRGVLSSTSILTIYLWEDYHSTSNLYVQRLDSLGNKTWDSLGIVVSYPSLSYEKIITDGNSGCIIVGTGGSFTIRAQQVNRDGMLGQIIDAVEEEKNIPDKFVLYQNHPNPFNSETHLKFEIRDLSHVTLEVYDVVGREISVLVSERKAPGIYTVTWNAKNYSSGVYLFRLRTEKSTSVKKMLLIR